MYISNESHRIYFLFNSSVIAFIQYVCIFVNVLNQVASSTWFNLEIKQKPIGRGWVFYSTVCVELYDFLNLIPRSPLCFLVPSLQKQIKYPFIDSNSTVNVLVYSYVLFLFLLWFHLHHSPLNFTPHLTILCNATHIYVWWLHM